MSEMRCALCHAPPCCLDCGEMSDDDAEIGDPCGSCGEPLRAPELRSHFYEEGPICVECDPASAACDPDADFD